MATTRKSTTRKSSGKVGKSSQTEVTAQSSSSDATDPIVEFERAYWEALDTREGATGTIPAEQIDRIRVTYREVPKRNQTRGNLAVKLNSEALQRAIQDGNVDPGMVQAIQAIQTLLTEINESSSQAPAPEHDPVPGVAGLLRALDFARESLLASLSDEQRERLNEVDPLDSDAEQAANGTIDCLAKMGTRVLNGRARRKPQRSGKDLGQVIRGCVEQNPDMPVDLSTIAKQGGVNSSGLWSRWKANQTEGVKATTDERGRRAFIAA
jgi:hypothetical protein